MPDSSRRELDAPASPIRLVAGQWQDQGACRDRPDIDWFPHRDAAGGLPREHRANIAAAKGVCASCPVRSLCLQEALTDPHTAGIWGGTTEHERRPMTRSPRQHNRVAECGTNAGYYRHLRITGTPPCPGCKTAHGEYESRRRIRG